nr:ribosomal protein S14 [Dinophyceae sp. MRD-151]
MAKKITIERECSRKKVAKKYSAIRTFLKKEFSERNSLGDRMLVHRKIQKIPRNSVTTRVRIRCQLSGRSRGYYRDFGLSRHFFRIIANQALLPGVRKSSWLQILFFGGGKINNRIYLK